MSACLPYRHELGAYVLDSLDDAERDAVAEHLNVCGECRAERERLAEASALLALVHSAPPPVPERVRDRVVAQAARRRRTRRWGAAVAAAVVVGVLLGGLAGARLAQPPPSERIAVPLEQVEPFEVTGWATYVPTDDGLLVELTLDGLEPLTGPAAYEAWLYTYDESLESLGRFAPEADGSVTLTMEAGGALTQYRGFWVTAEPDVEDPDQDGPTVVRAPVPESR